MAVLSRKAVRSSLFTAHIDGQKTGHMQHKGNRLSRKYQNG